MDGLLRESSLVKIFLGFLAHFCTYNCIQYLKKLDSDKLETFASLKNIHVIELSLFSELVLGLSKEDFNINKLRIRYNFLSSIGKYQIKRETNPINSINIKNIVQ
jgi:hypothetical protein